MDIHLQFADDKNILQKQSLLDILGNMQEKPSHYSQDFDFKKEYYEERATNMDSLADAHYTSDYFTSSSE